MQIRKNRFAIIQFGERVIVSLARLPNPAEPSALLKYT